ncbi:MULTISPECIES: FkbM family methyltransferase [unclassified Imperialibacter]|uniref:FkbM family methyltransferase n=1 Tax=unclassified Imperialibacter TaxID=2629706 RepID=UPI00125C0580|nr:MULTISPECIES: FkbM family methyltransferase [unclassified Imperialibacter]CAD5266898.1 putative SAM-dependent methyltransferase [Imperialibacter sp. 75]CAD5297120.1 putative SAM-dependent methyltransferase [Imperialibacter sp. 89]VVT27237.1 putative SAM-dependent methyltransferase [Imperialibacter sp. EC-SDR9]
MKSYLQNKLHKSLYNRAYSRAFYTMIGLSLKEIRCVFSQFYTIRYPFRSLFNIIGILFSSTTRLLLGRITKYSFAFTGEDRIIEGILKPIISNPCFYVDVGCNHPKFLSNTYGLYRKGWRGICIDANEKLIAKYCLYRPKDIAIAEVISNSVQQVDFYQIENNVLSTLDKNNLKEAVNLGLSYQTKNRETLTLNSILKKYNVPNKFDLLSIDCEEHDLEVLTSLDFSSYQPKLIVVEDETFDFKDYNNNKFVKFLVEREYSMIGYVLKNAYFLKN